MLKKILSPSSCAACRVCCEFDRSDIWETPLISAELRDFIIKNVDSTCNFTEQDGKIIFAPAYDNDGLAKCPMLSEKGCKLGEKKPFDCKIWPFRVMQVGSLLGITVSPVCETVSKTPLKALSDFVKNEIGDTIYKTAKLHPEIIKPYIADYPILSLRNADFTELNED